MRTEEVSLLKYQNVGNKKKLIGACDYHFNAEK